MPNMLIHPLTLSFDDKRLEKSFLSHEGSRLRVVDASAIALHGSTTLAALLRDFWLLLTASSWQTAMHTMATQTRVVGLKSQHLCGAIYIIFNLVCVSNPWLRWTPNRNTYLTAIRLVLPWFNLMASVAPSEMSQSYYTGT